MTNGDWITASSESFQEFPVVLRGGSALFQHIVLLFS